jgi:hypothetical protein
MFNDGVIGNLGIIEALGSLTAGTFNMNLKQGVMPYKLKDIIPSAHAYLYPPLSPEEQANQASKGLMSFAMNVSR